MANICPRCGMPLVAHDYCEKCDTNISVYSKIKASSMLLYNQGLQKAKVRDLSGSVDVLSRSIRLDKYNEKARNLLGLVYLELGETVLALQQWVVSKDIQPVDNEAVYFIDKIQNNQSYLEKLNTAVKKYNQSLVYIGQNSIDLAIIQLRKVIQLNSKFVKAYCLLSLCYVKENQKDKALKILTKVLSIDKSNYIARKYLSDINVETVNSGDFVEKDDATGYYGGPLSKSGTKISANNTVFQFLTVLVGVIIGLSVMAFLIMPSKIGMKNNEIQSFKTQLTITEEEKSASKEEISTLKSSLSKQEAANEGLTSEVKIVNGQMIELSRIVTALEKYIGDDLVGAADELYAVDTELLNDENGVVYTNLITMIYPEVAKTAWDNGYNNFRNKKYELGVEELERAYKYEKEDYYSDEVLYFLARCYNKLDNKDKALVVFEKMIEEYPEADKKDDAQYYINILKKD